MKFIYEETQLDEGYYIVRINDEAPVIAEYLPGLDTWLQTGIDFDIWRYNRRKVYEIEVIARINLDNMTIRLDV